MLVRRDGERVRLWSRNAIDFTAGLPVITAVAARIKARSFTIDGEAVVIGPDGLSQFEELRRGTGASRAILYAFDLIEHDGIDLQSRPLLDRKAALAKLLRTAKAGILLAEHTDVDGTIVFEYACKHGAEGIVSKRVDSVYRSGPHPAWIKVKNPAAVAMQRERSENWNR
jgi:bifunctional non-homologous end joining protein LigD